MTQTITEQFIIDEAEKAYASKGMPGALTVAFALAYSKTPDFVDAGRGAFQVYFEAGLYTVTRVAEESKE